MLYKSEEVERCQRCKCEIDPNESAEYRIIRNGVFGEEEVCLCDDCYRDFLDFLEVE